MSADNKSMENYPACKAQSQHQPASHMVNKNSMDPDPLASIETS